MTTLKPTADDLKPYPAGMPTEPGQLFRHTDGGYYRFLALARDTEDQEPRVIYQHVWPFAVEAWGRPASEWASRFTQVSQMQVDEAMLGDRALYQVTVRANKAARQSGAGDKTASAIGPKTMEALKALDASPAGGN